MTETHPAAAPGRTSLSDSVVLERDGAVRILTLNRADAMNAFDDELHHAFPAALRDVCRDQEARAIVVTGAGRAFSAGGDVGDFELFARDFVARREALRTGRQLFEDVINVPLPVIAAVNGPAVGLGCTLVSACDMVFMSEKA
jgi:enoyl-CoA hydratase